MEKMFGKMLEDILNLLKLIETAQFGNISNNKMMVRAKIRSDQCSKKKRTGLEEISIIGYILFYVVRF